MKHIVDFFNREQNLLIHFSMVIIVTILGFIFRLNETEWLFILLCFSFVISTEFINSSIEIAVDNYTDKYEPKAKIAKDVGASAVLVTAVMSAIIGLYIFLPKIIQIIK